MGTHLTTQKRGRGSQRYRAPGNKYYGPIRYKLLDNVTGQITALIHDPGRRAIVAEILLDDGKSTAEMIAPEGIRIGDKMFYRHIKTYVTPETFEYDHTLITNGSVLPLAMIPDGTTVFNLELDPNDGGKLGKTGGSGILIVGRDEDNGKVTVKLASKQLKVMDPRCRATIGIAAGGQRTEKPFMKAGYKMFAMRARGQVWPKVRGTAMSAYDHPHGGRSFGKSKTQARGTSPGRNVGLIAARRTGRRKGKRTRASGQTE